MANVVELPNPSMVVLLDGEVTIIRVSDMRRIAAGESSIAEFENPEQLARAMAAFIVDNI